MQCSSLAVPSTRASDTSTRCTATAPPQTVRFRLVVVENRACFLTWMAFVHTHRRHRVALSHARQHERSWTLRKVRLSQCIVRRRHTRSLTHCAVLRLGNFSRHFYPSARGGSCMQFMSSSHMFLFGGRGLDSNGEEGFLNDLWLAEDFAQWGWLAGAKASD